uniref:hypothetical protein n=1 Tax=Microbispora cellulosiformans TaxID=2614688 RepID=UPI001CD99308|nr:hypothetical protein [Microbispora cellulosiformans]
MNVTVANRLAISGSVRQKLLVSPAPQLGAVRVAHDHGCHGAGPAEVVAVERLQQFLDVGLAEAAGVALVVETNLRHV